MVQGSQSGSMLGILNTKTQPMSHGCYLQLVRLGRPPDVISKLTSGIPAWFALNQKNTPMFDEPKWGRSPALFAVPTARSKSPVSGPRTSQHAAPPWLCFVFDKTPLVGLKVKPKGQPKSNFWGAPPKKDAKEGFESLQICFHFQTGSLGITNSCPKTKTLHPSSPPQTGNPEGTIHHVPAPPPFESNGSWR